MFLTTILPEPSLYVCFFSVFNDSFFFAIVVICMFLVFFHDGSLLNRRYMSSGTLFSVWSPFTLSSLYLFPLTLTSPSSHLPPSSLSLHLHPSTFRLPHSHFHFTFIPYARTTNPKVVVACLPSSYNRTLPPKENAAANFVPSYHRSSHPHNFFSQVRVPPN